MDCNLSTPIKFSIVDDESGLVVGYCEDILGLSGDKYIWIDGQKFHEIILTKFYFEDNFKRYIKETKMYINNVYITIINIDGKDIGSYWFCFREPIYYHKKGFVEGLINFKLIGILTDIASPETLELWELWRKDSPLSKNQWVCLTEKERRGWLEIVKKYNCKVKLQHKDKMNETYYLDGSYVTDYPAFFCALGEAINGAGGYYGFDFLSLRDCFCGGFGAIPPFTLIWENSEVAMKSLDVEVWNREIVYRKELDSKLLKEVELYEKGDRPLFQAIVENFKEYVELVLR